jgi:hypothetical protein
MNTSRLTFTPTSAQTHFPGIPVDSQPQEELAKPHLESFPQPVFPAQKKLYHRLQQHPYHSSNPRQQQPACEVLPTGKTSDMGSPTPVPKHLNFITGNKNKLAEVCAREFSALSCPCMLFSYSACSENADAAGTC